MNQNERIMLTVAEAAEQAHMSPGAVRRLCVEGHLRHVKIGTKRLINQVVWSSYLQGEYEVINAPDAEYGTIRRIS